MTNQEIIARTQSDPIFALNFALDNNAQGVINSLQSNGFTNVTNVDEAKLILLGLLNQGDKDTVINIIKTVPYIDSNVNYTGGLKEYFLAKTPSYDPNARLDVNWAGLLAGLGIGISTYAANIAPKTPASPAQSQTDAAAAAAKLAADKKKKTITIVAIGGGVILLAIILWLAFRNKPTTKE